MDKMADSGIFDYEIRKAYVEGLQGAIRNMGFERFKVIELQNSDSLIPEAREHAKKSPAFYYHQYRTAVIDLSQFGDEFGAGRTIEFCIAHELAHFVTHEYLEEHGTKIAKDIKAKVVAVGIPDWSIEDFEISSEGLFYEGLSDLWESLIDELAYAILMWLERYKQGIIMSKWQDTEVAAKIEEAKAEARKTLLGSLFVGQIDDLAAKAMNALQRACVEHLMEPLSHHTQSTIAESFNKMANTEA